MSAIHHQAANRESLLPTANNENKMTRNIITRACDMCRKKKIKCDWLTPSCSHCVRYKTTCIYTPSRRNKRSSRTGPKGNNDLERRLTRMETALGLKASSVLNSSSNYASTALERTSVNEVDYPQGYDIQSISAFDTLTESPDYEPITDYSLPQTATEFSDMGKNGFSVHSSTSMTVLESAPDFHGGLAKFQPHREVATRSIAQTTTVEQHHQASYPLDPSKMVPLPPLNEALPLIYLYFTSFNQVYPLFHELSFMNLISERYMTTGLEDSGWWGSINIIISQGYNLRAMSPNKGPDDEQKSMTYLQNASIVGPQIMLWGCDFLSLQALLGMAIVVHGKSNSGCYPVLVAAAVRLAYMLGLHRQQDYDPKLTATEIEQRKRVFWIIYILDKNVSLRSDIPFLQNDEDINVDLPMQDVRGRIHFVKSGKVESVDIFSLHVRLSVVQGMICKQLYAATSNFQGLKQRDSAIQRLDRGLKEWRDSIPFDFSSECSKSILDELSILHIIVLHSAYFFSLMKLHHIPLPRVSSQTTSKGIESFNPRLFAPEHSCIVVAREFMDLIKVAPQGGSACIWLILYPAVSALITLLHNALHHPDDIHAPFDTERVDPLLSILASLAEMKENKEILRMHIFCAELKRRALATVTMYMDTHQRERV